MLELEDHGPSASECGETGPGSISLPALSEEPRQTFQARQIHSCRESRRRRNRNDPGQTKWHTHVVAWMLSRGERQAGGRPALSASQFNLGLDKRFWKVPLQQEIPLFALLGCDELCSFSSAL